MIRLQKFYVVSHTWRFANGEEGHVEFHFTDKDEARERFLYLQLLIETDTYKFDAVIPDFDSKNDSTYSVYEKVDSPVNRQDLVFYVEEVSI